MSRAVLVEGRAAVGLDGDAVGTLHGSGEALTLDVPGLFTALRIARAAGGSTARAARLRRLGWISRETGVRFEMSVRGRSIARIRENGSRTVELRIGAILRSLLPG